jgi:aldose 1-epimerase
MFQIIQKPFGSFTAFSIINIITKEEVSFVPEYGANLLSLQLQKNGLLHEIIDGFTTDEQLRQNEKSRSIHLSPFPNRIEDGKYVFEDILYQLPINKPKENNAIHGFVWNKPFVISNQIIVADYAAITLEYCYDGKEMGYPFLFSQKIAYRLSAHQLSVIIIIENIGKANMPLGYGWHPYFTLLNPVDELLLQLPPSNLLEANERLIPNGNKTAYLSFNTLQPINNTLFDTVFQLMNNNWNKTLLYNETENYGVQINQSPSLKYLQVYIPEQRKSIAIEPMSCAANAFNSLEDLIVLQPNEKFEASIEIAII